MASTKAGDADIRQERPDWYLFRDGCPGGESVAAVGARADHVITRLRAIDGAFWCSATAIFYVSWRRAGWACPPQTPVILYSPRQH